MEALQQVTGVAVASVTAAAAQFASQVADDKSTNTLTQEQQSLTATATHGVVSAYRVLSATEGVPVTVELAVTVEVFEPKGLGNETRRRIAVASFAGSQGGTADTLRERITAHLVQSRRFAVVDRTQDAAFAREMNLLQSDAVPLTERARLGQVIGADYLVTGQVRQTAATRTAHTLDLTGEVIVNTTAASATADYQVIEIATRQIKWAGTARIAGADSIDGIATRIAMDIARTIYPLRLIKFDNPEALIINQGGDSVQPGERFRAFVLGEALTDPYTHESLGEVEDEVGIVEIRRVDPKLSYARVVTGHLPAPAGESVRIVLRPAGNAPPPAGARAGRARPAAQAAPAITKLPFDP